VYLGKKDCDHAHDGKGFIIAHIALSNLFEKSLQTVNPAIALPYWVRMQTRARIGMSTSMNMHYTLTLNIFIWQDYTIEGARVKQNDDDLGVWFTSEVFNDDWFGEAGPSDHVLTKGTFAYTRVRSDIEVGFAFNAALEPDH
jgi:hypothetical protein